MSFALHTAWRFSLRLGIVSLASCRYHAQAIGSLHLCTPTMTSFNFRPVQILELTAEDSPRIDVHEGTLILTAERAGEQIRITAPLQNMLPQVATTQVKAPAVPKRRRVYRYITGGEKRAGELNGMAKLTDAQVKEIRLLLSNAKFLDNFSSTHSMYEKLAETYKVHFATIRSIARFESWKHITV